MPRAPRSPRVYRHESPFNLGTLINVGGIPVLSAGFIFIGFYFTTGDTLRQHEKSIAEMKQHATDFSEKELKQREETRKLFSDAQQKNVELLSTMNTRLAVQETKQEAANQTLTKIADELARITSIKH